MKPLRHFILLLAACLTCPLSAQTPNWHGYPRHDFLFETHGGMVVSPLHEPAMFEGGKAWIWKARFVDHRPDLDLALLELGFHVVYLDDNAEMLGSPQSIAWYDRFHDQIVKEYGLSRRAALEGLSRGGLYVYNYAAAHPDKVACIYGDCAVMDFKSWPAGKAVYPEMAGPGTKDSWEKMKKSYGFKDDAAAKAWDKNPVDHAAIFAAAKMPIIAVVGEADNVVPPKENVYLLKSRLDAIGAGGLMQILSKPGQGHAHGAENVADLVQFIVKNTCGQANTRPILAGIKRIVFLGDSITHAGKYIEYVQGMLITRFPERQWEFINLGLSSETTSGLSEEGHAGGKFPRPNVHDRLARALKQTRPDLVIACYGMNDGIYKPLEDQRLVAFQTGITKLADAVQAGGAKLILLTPPVFDPVPLKKTSEDGNGPPFKDYDKVLARFGQWELEQKATGWTVADIHGPMSAYIASRRGKDPMFTLSRDGVHPGAVGHWFMALAILRQLGLTPESDIAAIEGTRMGRGNVTRLSTAANGEVSFTWLTRIPMPRDPEWEKDADFAASADAPSRWDIHRLSVSGLKAAKYALIERAESGEVVLGGFAAVELGKGIDVTKLPRFSINTRSNQLGKLVHDQMSTLGSSWLTEVGHNRPGVAKGLPLDQAQAKSAELEKSIRELTAPAAVSLRLVPITGGKP